MTVLAHGAVGWADEIALVVPSLVVLVLFVSWLRRLNARRATPPASR